MEKVMVYRDGSIHTEKIDEKLVLDIIEECKGFGTSDIQHDLALLSTNGDWDEMNEAYKCILESRGEKLPANCQMVHNTSAYLNKELQFELV